MKYVFIVICILLIIIILIIYFSKDTYNMNMYSDKIENVCRD